MHVITDSFKFGEKSHSSSTGGTLDGAKRKESGQKGKMELYLSALPNRTPHGKRPTETRKYHTAVLKRIKRVTCKWHKQQLGA